VETEEQFRLALKESTFDIIVCDYHLPTFNGGAALMILEALDLDTPFILVSGKFSEEEKDKAFFTKGVSDFVSKDRLTRLRSIVQRELRLSAAYDQTLQSWANALELRDRETKGHSERVVGLTVRLAHKIGVDETEIIHYKRGALLHDIGKMAIPDAILLKPDRLTEDEFAKIKEHPQIAYDLLQPIRFLRKSLDIPYCHHEKFDGSGYPRGLKGSEIPLSARIFAIVDVFDALTSNRPYHLWVSSRVALETIQFQAGRHFDPAIVDEFVRMVNNGGSR